MVELESLEVGASSAEARGDWSQAEQLWGQLVGRWPSHGSGWHRLGKALAQQERWNEALACQLRSCGLHTQLGWNWFAAGEVRERLGDGQGAAADFRQAAWQLPEEPWILDVARRAEQRQWLGGEDLQEGLGRQAYRHWCDRLEPALPRAGQPLRECWWHQEAGGRWARWDGEHRVIDRQRGPWPPGDGWVVVMAADARLRREGLLAMEEAIMAAEMPAQLAYADEDRLDAQGRRYDPWFKPGWVLESFWSSPWLEACSVWRLGWLRDQGLPPPPSSQLPSTQADAGMGLWAWQLAALERRPQVLAVPRVLVHRVVGQGADRVVDPAAQHARAAALERQLRGQGEAVRVSAEAVAGRFRLEWALPAALPAVQVVIPSKDQAGLLGRALESLHSTCGRYPDLQITVVDHASRERATATLLAGWRRRLGDRLRVKRMGGSFNWSRLNNSAIRSGRAPLLLLLNNDVEALTAGWLEVMVAQALRPAIGAVGAVLLYPDRRIQHAGIGLGHGLDRCGAEHAYRGLAWPPEVHRGRAGLLSGWAAVTGACLMVSRQNWQLLGGFDERLPVEGNDVDFCLRLGQLGLRQVVEPKALLLHHECQSRDPGRSTTERAALQRLQRLHPQAMAQLDPWLPPGSSRLHSDGRPAELDGYP